MESGPAECQIEGEKRRGGGGGELGYRDGDEGMGWEG